MLLPAASVTRGRGRVNGEVGSGNGNGHQAMVPDYAGAPQDEVVPVATEEIPY